MIELNLLPDIKLEFIKAQRARRLVLSVAFLISALTIGLLILLFSFSLLQKKHLSDVNTDITASSSKLKAAKDIDRILTVQNQLDSLTKLHETKPDSSKLLGYLNLVTPAQISLNSLHADFTSQAMTISGTADNLSAVNKYVDTLKLAKYTTKDNTEPSPAFNEVKLTSFSVSAGQTSGKTATFTIDLVYSPDIFNITTETKLIVPTITNRLEAADLFQSPAAAAGGSN